MDKFLRKKIVKKEIDMENKKFKIHKINIIAITMLFLCLCISSMARISTNQRLVNAMAETCVDNIVIDNWKYLSNIEKKYREDNPNITPTQMVSFLDDKILELYQAEEDNIMLLSNDSTVGDSSYNIFGETVTSAEIALVVAYPAQSLIAFNASEDARECVPNFYEGGFGLNNADAFRHAYWNALMDRRISKDVLINTGTPEFPVYTTIQIDFAKEFADAHEYGKTGIDPEMDLRNNALGRSDSQIYAELDENELALKIVERISLGHYWRIINEELDENNQVVGGELVRTDWTGLVSKYFQQIMFDVTVIGENIIRLDKVKWDVQGAYELPATLNEITLVEVSSNAFANQSQITSVTLPNTITSIGANAFSGCTSLTSINIPANVMSIGSGAFVGCSSLTNITIPAGVTYIGEGAFAGCSNLNISVNTSNPNYSAQGNILYNKTETKIIGSGDIAANITVSNTVTEIGASAFSGNTNLQRLDIYGTPVIDDLAFYNCTNLDEVYFYSYTVPEIGSGAFVDNEFTLYVPHSKQSSYMAEFVGYTNNITSLAINVTLMVDDEVYDTVDTYYGATIAGVTDPFKVGYIFNYWTDDNGNIYQNEGVWDSTVNLTVNANWTPRQSYINFVGFGTDSIENKLVTYDQAIGALPIPDATGPTFIGWKDSNGIYYSENDIWKQTNNLTLIADYEGEESGDILLYYVDLDQDGGEGGSDNVQAEYLAPMPTATAPTRTGYDFKGYYTGKNGTGEKYYNEDMSSAKNWDIPRDTTLYAYWEGYKYIVTLNQNGGTGGTTSVEVTYGSDMPTSGMIAPKKTGYTFDGYYDENNKQYYIGPNMISSQEWDKLSSATLWAKWTVNEYTITLYWWEGRTSEIIVTYGSPVVVDSLLTKQHYEFKGFYSEPGGNGTQYVETKKDDKTGFFLLVPDSSDAIWTQASNGILYAHWEKLTINNYTYEMYSVGEDIMGTRSIKLESGIKTKLTAEAISGYTFKSWEINGQTFTDAIIEYTFELHRSYITGEVTIFNPNYTTSIAYSDGYISLKYTKNECVAAGTLITLADGRQVPVETLTGNEMLLVWNMRTGTFDVAPILFIDQDALATYKIINLQFSDGTQVKVISEHAFFDCNLNKYVYLREDAGKYIGHWFNKQTTDANGNLIWTKVQLTNVSITQEVTTAYSPVTYDHLCLYVNGMLSMPGGIDGLINIFEVDGETMQINQAKYLEDIATYGLFTYEEFYELYQVPEEMFEACGGQYLKVAIGKGLLDYERLGQLIERYAEFFA